MSMERERYSAYEIVQIKSSFAYLMLLVLLTVIAISFLIASSIKAVDFILPTIINSIGITIAYLIYSRKKKRRKVSILPWIMGFITVMVPMIQKYKYGFTIDWTFALESYNSSILLVIFIIMLQLLHNRRLFIFYAVFGITNWIIFILVANHYGGVMHLNALENGQPVHGVIVLREVFFIIVNILLVYISYRFIPVMEEFDRRTTDQRSVIEKQADQQRMINREIKERMSVLVDQVDEQNLLIRGFNEKMQNQSATFEELSATLEELLSSAENIHVSSVDQIDGNVKMEEIVNEFKTIKVETTKNLKTTYDDIEGIVAKTSISNESLRDVERTIEKIKQQSGKIGETVSIIVDIADKINLLSLNAAIEAARAGDSGKGFAVVADEIGKLAYRTTESIKEIESVLRANTAITAEGVDVIKNTADMIKELIGDMASSSEKIKVLQESILVEERFINIIIDQMFKNIELAKSIGVGTEEQKLAIESSTKAIEHVNEIVGEMVKEIRNLSVTSQKILENSTELMQKSRESVE
jgi:methyl-accepting chemotaxis protein